MALKCLTCKAIADESDLMVQLDDSGAFMCHIDCLSCNDCKANLNLPNFVICEENEQLLCLNCYAGSIMNFCSYCGQNLSADCVKINQRQFHQDCSFKFTKISDGQAAIDHWPELTSKFLDCLNLDFNALDSDAQNGFNPLNGDAAADPLLPDAGDEPTSGSSNSVQQLQPQLPQTIEQPADHLHLQQPVNGNQELLQAPEDNQSRPESSSQQQQQQLPDPAALQPPIKGEAESHSGPEVQVDPSQQVDPQHQIPNPLSQRSQIKEELWLAYPSTSSNLGDLEIEQHLQEREQQQGDQVVEVADLEDILGSLFPTDEIPEFQQQELLPQSDDKNTSHGLGPGPTPQSNASTADELDRPSELLKNLIDETLGNESETIVANDQVQADSGSSRKRPHENDEGPQRMKKLPPRIKMEPLENSFPPTSRAVPLSNLTNKFQPPRIVSVGGKPQILRQTLVPRQSSTGQQSVIYQIVDDSSTSISPTPVDDATTDSLFRLVYEDEAPPVERFLLGQATSDHRVSASSVPPPPRVDVQDRIQAPLYGQSSMRHRAVISSEHRLILEEAFQKSHFPNRATRVKLGFKTNLDQRQVQIWFQNQRSKAKKMKMAI